MPKRRSKIFKDYSWDKQFRLKLFASKLASNTDINTLEELLTSDSSVSISETNGAPDCENNNSEYNREKYIQGHASTAFTENPEDDLNDAGTDSLSDTESNCSTETVEESTQNGNLFDELYPGAPINVAELIMSMTALTMRHRLTKACISDFLKLISVICISPNKCPRSLYQLNKSFSDLEQAPLNKHFYCSNCFSPIDSEQTRGQVCLNCNNRLRNEYFIESPIISQIKLLYKRPGFYEKLMHRFNLPTRQEHNFGDIYDGKLYTKLSKTNGFLSNSNNISLTWYTDGVNIFKSSKFNIWPFFFAINELPYEDRFKIENVLLVGLWFGEMKPEPLTFLSPLEPALRALYHGIEVYVPSTTSTITVRGINLTGTCDLPAKSLFFNMNQFNGAFGCQKCKEEGQIIDNIRIYPYTRRLNLRSDAETATHALQAYESNVKVCGVTGPSIMSKIVYKFIQSTAIDSMHCVFEGVAKRLLQLWFEPQFSGESFSISCVVKLVDIQLCSIKPPAYVQRLPRSIEKHHKYWMASEMKNWLYYNSLPILHDILRPESFEHYKLLVLGVSLLHQENVSIDKVDLADEALREFVARYEELYGRKRMTCNLHHLRHLADTVRNTGPLWTTSCFPFEDLNGKLKSLVHSSKSADLQIFLSISRYINYCTAQDKWLIQNSVPYTFCDGLLNSQKKCKLKKISNGLYIVGHVLKLEVLSTDIDTTALNDLIYNKNVYVFKKLLKKKLLFTSKLCKRSKKSKSYCVKYLDGAGASCHGFINFYLRLTNCNCEEFCDCAARHLAVVTKCSTEDAIYTNFQNGTLASFKKIISEFNDVVAIDLDWIKCICFHIHLQDADINFIVEPVNTLEKE